jgi:hypothetical protein
MSNEILIIESKNLEIEQLKTQLELMKRQNIAILGDGEVFLRKTASGGVKSVKGVVTLSEELGEIYEIPGYGDIPSKYSITAVGYFKLNQVAGVSIITPKSLRLENGDVVVNPFIVRDTNGQVSGVWLRKTSIGRSPTGNISMISSTLQYDVSQYFLSDLIKKVKNNSRAGRLCNSKTLTDDELKKGIFMPVFGEMGIWVNLEDKDVYKAVETLSENRKFAERKAQTIAERNALKKHPAFSQVYVSPQGVKPKRIAKVCVVGWTCDLTETELQKLAEQVDSGDEIEVDGQKVHFVDAIDMVEDEDIIVSADEEEVVVREDEIEEIHPDPQPETVLDEREYDVLIEKIEEAAETLGAEKAADILKKNMKTSIDKLKKPQYKMALQLLTEEIGRAAK